MRLDGELLLFVRHDDEVLDVGESEDEQIGRLIYFFIVPSSNIVGTLWAWLRPTAAQTR